VFGIVKCRLYSGPGTSTTKNQAYNDYYLLVGFGRACTPVRCAHPSFLAHCHAKTGAARPPDRPASYSSPKNKKINYFQKQMLYFRLELGPPGVYRISFHRTTEALIHNTPRPLPRPTHRTLLSCSAPKKIMSPVPAPTPAPPIAASLLLLANNTYMEKNPAKNHNIGPRVISH
jgi:hypothetical protein